MAGNGRRWTRWTAVLLGAATFFALPGIATARLSSESSSTTIASLQNGTATAKCGSGKTAVAGGFAAPGFDPTADTGPTILTYASARPNDGKWRASGHNYANPQMMRPKGSPGAGPISAYVYCDKNDPSVTVRSKSTTLSRGQHATLTPKCPKGREAVSGGFQSDAPTPDSQDFTDYVYTSKRSGDRAWKVGAVDIDASPHKVTAFAYCEKQAPDLVSRSTKQTISTGPMAGTATIKAKCPKGGKAFSGGYKSTFEQATLGFTTSIAFTSKRSEGQSWKVAALAAVLNSTGAPTEKAIVYCTT